MDQGPAGAHYNCPRTRRLLARFLKGTWIVDDNYDKTAAVIEAAMHGFKATFTSATRLGIPPGMVLEALARTYAINVGLILADEQALRNFWQQPHAINVLNNMMLGILATVLEQLRPYFPTEVAAFREGQSRFLGEQVLAEVNLNQPPEAEIPAITPEPDEARPTLAQYTAQVSVASGAIASTVNALARKGIGTAAIVEGQQQQYLSMALMTLTKDLPPERLQKVMHDTNMVEQAQTASFHAIVQAVRKHFPLEIDDYLKRREEMRTALKLDEQP